MGTVLIREHLLDQAHPLQRNEVAGTFENGLLLDRAVMLGIHRLESMPLEQRYDLGLVAQPARMALAVAAQEYSPAGRFSDLAIKSADPPTPLALERDSMGTIGSVDMDPLAGLCTSQFIDAKRGVTFAQVGKEAAVVDPAVDDNRGIARAPATIEEQQHRRETI